MARLSAVPPPYTDPVTCVTCGTAPRPCPLWITFPYHMYTEPRAPSSKFPKMGIAFKRVLRPLEAAQGLDLGQDIAYATIAVLL
jgi:hypothetical protein